MNKEKFHDIFTDVSAYSAYWVTTTIIGSAGTLLVNAVTKNRVLAGIGSAISIIGGIAIGEVVEETVRNNSKKLLINQIIDLLPEKK